MERFSEIVQNAAQQSQAFMDGVNANMETALEDLFASIDLNNDGVISKDEFAGMSLNTWAMLRSLTSCINCLPNLPAMKHLFQSIPTDLTYQKLQESFPSFLPVSVPEILGGYSWFTIYFMFLFGFQTLLFLLENWRYMAGLRCTWRFTDQPEKKPVIKVDKSVGLSYDTPITWYECVKMCIMTVTGFALFRFIMVVLCFTIGVVCVNIATWYQPKWWRSFWMYMTHLAVLAICAHMGFMRIPVTGKLEDASKVKLLVANHFCVLEVLVLYTLSGGCSFVSAVENLGLPLFQGVVEASDALLVDRNGTESKKMVIEEVKRRALREDGNQLMMFPEGTLNNQQALFKFKAGPFIPGVPVQPVCFRVPYRHFNPCWTGEATGGHKLQDLCWRNMCQLVNRMEVKILPVYYPSEEEKKDPELYGNNVRDVMARALDMPVCDATFMDYMDCQSKYTEALEQSKKDKGRFNFAKARAEMRAQRALARQRIEETVKDWKQGRQRMAEGPAAFQNAHPKGLLSNYEDSEGGYITQEGVKKLVQYKYQGGEYSMLDNIMNPFWAKFALLMPRSISPNAITLTGFLGFIVGLGLISYDALHSGNPEVAASGNRYVQFMTAFLMWFYQTMDAVDGKHARNTGQSSPLGALFDHGCDACAMVIGALCVELTASHPADFAMNQRGVHLAAFIMPLNTFYVAQWEHYHVGILPTSGVTEAQVQAAALVASAGIWRLGIFAQLGDVVALPEILVRFANWTILELMESVVIASSVWIMLGSVRRVVKKTGSIVPLATFAPFLLHHVQIAFIAFSPCFACCRILALLMFGLNFADLSLRMIISGLCGIKYPFIHWPTVPFTLVSFWMVFGATTSDCFDVLICTIIWQVVSILWLTSDTIARICSCLDIPFLAARPQLVEEKKNN